MSSEAKKTKGMRKTRILDVAEELFVLLAEMGVESVSIVLAPLDLRTREFPQALLLSDWRGELYSDIEAELGKLRADSFEDSTE